MLPCIQRTESHVIKCDRLSKITYLKSKKLKFVAFEEINVYCLSCFYVIQSNKLFWSQDFQPSWNV